MDERVLYCIATWCGDRRKRCLRYKIDPSCYLRAHIERLQNLKHSLTAIAIINPYVKQESKQFRKYLGVVQKLTDPTPCFILQRPNFAASYGSWLHAYEAFGANYTHYLLMEDDYAPVIHHFDSELLAIMNATSNCGAVFSCLSDIPAFEKVTFESNKVFATISNGLVAGWAFKQAIDILRKVSHEEKPGGPYNPEYQIQWTSAFADAGVVVKDVRDRFKIQFRSRKGKLWYHPNNNATIFEVI